MCQMENSWDRKELNQTLGFKADFLQICDFY